MLSSTTRRVLLRRGLTLEYLTLAWNVVGATVVIAAALAAGSVALAGFGLDSLIEIGASVVVVWQLNDPDDERERPALRLIGGAFIALAIYIAAQATTPHHRRPSSQLHARNHLDGRDGRGHARARRRQGPHRQSPENPVLQTEAQVTLIDAYLAAAVLLGLVLNATARWWWANPLAGLVIVYYGLREGRQALTHNR